MDLHVYIEQKETVLVNKLHFLINGPTDFAHTFINYSRKLTFSYHDIEFGFISHFDQIHEHKGYLFGVTIYL